MKDILHNRDGFWGLLGLLLAACLSMWLVYIAFTKYYSSSTVSSSQEYKSLAPVSGGQQGVPPYQSVLEDAKSRIRAVEKIELQREDDLMRAAQGMTGGGGSASNP